MIKLGIGFLLCLASITNAWSQDCTSRLQAILDHSGYQVRVLKPCESWMLTEVQTVPRGDGITGLLLVGVQDDIVVIGTVVRTKAKLELTVDLSRKLLQLNHEIQWIKIGIDHDGDLFVREEYRLDHLTPDAFNDAITDVANASKEVAALFDK